MRDLWQDFRYGLRMLLRNPGFTVVAVLSLAIGIGINSTLFSALDAAFIRPLPFRNPSEIVRFEQPMFSFQEYEQFRPQLGSLASLAASSRHAAQLRIPEGSEMLGALIVSDNYFATLGIQPAAGTVFSATAGGLRTESIVVISYGLWQRRFGGDARVVGQTITLNGRPWTVMGVAGKGFNGEFRIPPADVWFPFGGAGGGDVRDYQLIGRLKPGSTVEQAAAEAKVVYDRMPWREPKERRPDGVWVWSEADATMDHGGKLAVIAMALVGLVLLVACANVTSLLLARNEERRRELAVRLALGGTRFRLVRQLLAEGLALAMLGAVVGLVLTSWAIRALPALIPITFVSLTPELHVDRRVLELTFGLSVLATLVFALLPAARATRIDLGPLLKGETSSHQGSARALTSRNVLVIGQLAVSLVFLAASGLLLHGFFRGLNTDMGFTRRNALLMFLCPGLNGLNVEQSSTYLTQAAERLGMLPGVVGASLVAHAPFALSGGGMAVKAVGLNGEIEAEDRAPSILCNVIEPGYFATMGIRLLQGRSFNEHDDRTSGRVAIISQAMARKYWPTENPVGRTIRVGFDRTVPREVVGVASDAANTEVGNTPPSYVYLPFRQEPRSEMTLVIATVGRPTALVDSVRRELRRLDERVEPLTIETLAGSVRLALMPQWIGLWLGGVLGLLAFALALVGLYGVVSYSVSQRTHELGIRMAMGARPRDTVWLVLRQGLILGLAGTAVGLPLALAASMALRSLLFGLGALDPIVLLGAFLLVLGIALVACYIPARRAAHLDPMAALRYE